MDNFLKMDVFFAVTTAVVFVGGAFAIVALFYAIKILRSCDEVMKNVSEESDAIREDIHIVRAKVRDEGMKIKHFMDFFGGLSGARRTVRAKKKHERSESV